MNQERPGWFRLNKGDGTPMARIRVAAVDVVTTRGYSVLFLLRSGETLSYESPSAEEAAADAARFADALAEAEQ